MKRYCLEEMIINWSRRKGTNSKLLSWCSEDRA